MNINETMKTKCGDIWLRAMGADSAAATEIIGKCQAVLDNGEVVRIFPWQASEEDLMLAEARRGLERIVLTDWFRQYTTEEMQAMCRLLSRGPDGEFTKVTILDGMTLLITEVIRRYNEIRSADVHLEDPDFG